jgi:hypothetical protein
MRAGKNKWVRLALVLIFAVVVGIYVGRQSDSARVSLSFIANTNIDYTSPLKQGITHFALFSVTNHERVSIYCYGCLCENSDGSCKPATTLRVNLAQPPSAVLEAGRGWMFAVGQPTNAAGKWRIQFFYKRMTLKLQIKDYAWNHSGTFPFSLLRLSPRAPQLWTNTSVWIKAEAH